MNERNITLISQTPQSIFSPLVVSREVTEIWDFVLHLTLLDKLTSCRITPLALFKLHGRGRLAPTQATEIQQRRHCLPT